ncbi:hypothetical protein Tsubulata_015184 [Turnera subulata]|uniref:Uncharacterized protein n=1 Tax=Turnera subulata TaxID=218843 RepID=A0A9Q0F6Z5_9ROSI|nr:hypothetical protein Tsubulata_015184 [Turnera subulata]
MDNQNASATDNAAAVNHQHKRSRTAGSMSHSSGEASPASSPFRTAQEGVCLSPGTPPLTPGKRGGFDPKRIPSSIFASKPANPGEWSVTSNESLFSIHMGNNSFSKEQYAYMLYKSGELPRPDEMCSYSPAPPGLLPVYEAEVMETKNVPEVKKEDKSPEAKKVPEDVKEDKSAEAASIRSEKVAPVEPAPAKSSTLTEKTMQIEDVRNSASSTRSFQFPVLEPTMADTSVTVTLQTKGSEKQSPPQQSPPQQQPPTPAPDTISPKAAGNSWFSCFSCWR